MTSINIAKKAFELPNKGGSSSDYLTNKKSKLLVCNRQGNCNNKKVSSYEQKILIDNGKLIETPLDTYTNDLYSNLRMQLDYSGAKLVTDISSNNVTCINVSLLPFYNSYKIDEDGDMFGKTVCAENNFVNYRVPANQNIQGNAVYWN